MEKKGFAATMLKALTRPRAPGKRAVKPNTEMLGEYHAASTHLATAPDPDQSVVSASDVEGDELVDSAGEGEGSGSGSAPEKHSLALDSKQNPDSLSPTDGVEGRNNAQTAAADQAGTTSISEASHGASARKTAEQPVDGAPPSSEVLAPPNDDSVVSKTSAQSPPMNRVQPTSQQEVLRRSAYDQPAADYARNSQEVGFEDQNRQQQAKAFGPDDLSETRLLCCICLSNDSGFDEDELVTCAGCGLQVHVGCYGNEPDSLQNKASKSEHDLDYWFCEPCCAGHASPPCALCPNEGGAVKACDVPNWYVHSVCALYNQAIKWGNHNTLTPMLLVDVPPEAFHAQACCLCGKSEGVCIPCDAVFCNALFHASCAHKLGLLSEGTDKHSDFRFKARCPEHADVIQTKLANRLYRRVFAQMASFQPVMDEEVIQSLGRKRAVFRQYMMEWSHSAAAWKHQRDTHRAAILARLQEYQEAHAGRPESAAPRKTKKHKPGRPKKAGQNDREGLPSALPLPLSLSEAARPSGPALTVSFVQEYHMWEQRCQAAVSDIQSLQVQQKALKAQAEFYRKRLRPAFSKAQAVLKSCKIENSLSRLASLLDEAGRHFGFGMGPNHARQQGDDMVIGANLVRTLPNVCQATRSRVQRLQTLVAEARRRQLPCKICGHASDFPKMARCATCEGQFHIYCLSPPLEWVPGEDPDCPWRCWNCLEHSMKQQARAENSRRDLALQKRKANDNSDATQDDSQAKKRARKSKATSKQGSTASTDAVDPEEKKRLSRERKRQRRRERREKEQQAKQERLAIAQTLSLQSPEEEHRRSMVRIQGLMGSIELLNGDYLYAGRNGNTTYYKKTLQADKAVYLFYDKEDLSWNISFAVGDKDVYLYCYDRAHFPWLCKEPWIVLGDDGDFRANSDVSVSLVVF